MLLLPAAGREWNVLVDDDPLARAMGTEVGSGEGSAGDKPEKMPVLSFNGIASEEGKASSSTRSFLRK